MIDEPLNTEELLLLDIYSRSSPERQAFIFEVIAAINGSGNMEQAIAKAPPKLREKLLGKIQH